jgi:hypothetical protein
MRTLTIDDLECLRTAVREISKGWEFALRDIFPKNIKESPNAILMFWGGETEFYRPTISVEGILSGYKITTWDIEDFMALGTWSRSHETTFNDVVSRIQTIARKESEYAAYARSIKTNEPCFDVYQSSSVQEEGISEVHSRASPNGVTWFPRVHHSVETS